MMRRILLGVLLVGLAVGRETLVLPVNEQRTVRITNATLFGSAIAALAMRDDSVCLPLQWSDPIDVTPVDCLSGTQAVIGPSKCFTVGGHRSANSAIVRVACLQQHSTNMQGFLHVRVVNVPPTCNNFTMSFNPSRWSNETYLEFGLKATDPDGEVIYILSNRSVRALKGTLRYCIDENCNVVDPNDWANPNEGVFRYAPPRLPMGASESLKYYAMDSSMSGCTGIVTFRAANIPPATLQPIPEQQLFAHRGVLIGASLVAQEGSPSMRFQVQVPEDPSCLRVCPPPQYLMNELIDTGSATLTEDVDMYCTSGRAIKRSTDISAFHFRHRVAYAMVMPLRACRSTITFVADNTNGHTRRTTVKVVAYQAQCQAATVSHGDTLTLSRVLTLIGPSDAPLPSPELQFVMNGIFLQNNSVHLTLTSTLVVRRDAVSGVVTFRSDLLPTMACYVAIAANDSGSMRNPQTTTTGLWLIVLIAVVLISAAYIARGRMLRAAIPRGTRLPTAEDDSDDGGAHVSSDPFRNNPPPAVASAKSTHIA